MAIVKMVASLFVLAGLLIILLVLEARRHALIIQRVPIRILVNGTRGKTSVTRLITAALQGGGIRACGKCTGTDPREIMPDGSEISTPRPQFARITELKGFMRRAARQDARAVVIECMAVQPEMQNVLARLLVKPTITIITNTLVDHIEEIGETRRQTAMTLASSLLPSTLLISDEPFFSSWPGVASSDREPLPDNYDQRFSFPVFETNIRLALAAAVRCGVSRRTALDAIPLAMPDAGLAGPFHPNGSLVINAFAANDPVSTKAHIDTFVDSILGKAKVMIIYNHRADRTYRLRSFLPLMKEWTSFSPVLMVIGDNPLQAARFFSRRLTYPCGPIKIEQLLIKDFYRPDTAIFSVGNIKGDGHRMIDYLMKLRD